MGEEDLFLFFYALESLRNLNSRGRLGVREPAAPSSSPIGPALENMGLTSYKDCVK